MNPQIRKVWRIAVKEAGEIRSYTQEDIDYGVKRLEARLAELGLLLAQEEDRNERESSCRR